MTVGSTIDFSLTAEELVKEARGALGIQAHEEPLQAHELQQGLRTLNAMVKAWQAVGTMTWTLTEGSFALVQGDVDYVFGSGGTVTTVPFEVTDARITRGGTDLPMWPLSREDYFSIPLKTTQGYPTQFYYDRQRESGTFYVWPAPDATGGTIKFTYRRSIFDFDTSSDTMDLPQEWYEAVVWNLADRLLSYYPTTDAVIVQRVMQRAASSYAVVKSFDTGEGQGSISILPGGHRMGSQRR
jgi:hypothetical protein